MELGMIGLGRMGGNLTRRLLEGGHRIVTYDQNPEAVAITMVDGAEGVDSLGKLVDRLTRPRVAWSMLPSGLPTEGAIQSLLTLLSPGDTIVDGGNCHYKDTMRRADTAHQMGLYYMDVGISGGITGIKEGYSLMVGGDEMLFNRLEPIFQTLAPSQDKGYGYVGPSGAGHYVKMVHNGIEYGLMQAYAEGFEILASKKEFEFELDRVTRIWQHGSVIRSRLLDFLEEVFSQDTELKDILGYVEDTGEGRWTVGEAIDLDVPTPVISAALQRRLRSRQDQPYGDRLLAALRNVFGGHTVHRL